MIVLVRDGNLDQANRILKKRMQKSKIYEEIKNKSMKIFPQIEKIALYLKTL